MDILRSTGCTFLMGFIGSIVTPSTENHSPGWMGRYSPIIFNIVDIARSPSSQNSRFKQQQANSERILLGESVSHLNVDVTGLSLLLAACHGLYAHMY
jgi:hypothetical protein